jgi:hypothetical protein
MGDLRLVAELGIDVRSQRYKGPAETKRSVGL